jgi:hypothetical protein
MKEKHNDKGQDDERDLIGSHLGMQDDNSIEKNENIISISVRKMRGGQE